MFKEHAPLIAEYGNASPEGMLDVITFVLSTIQTPISRASDVAEDIRNNGAHSKYLNSSKRAALLHVKKRKHRMYDKLQSCRSVNDAIENIIKVPGLGVVKASFVAQLLGFEVGCIDRHNVILYNVAPAVIKIPSQLTRETKRFKIDTYVSICQEIGGSEVMWDRWCEYVAGTKWNKKLPTAELVSAEHIKGCNVHV